MEPVPNACGFGKPADQKPFFWIDDRGNVTGRVHVAFSGAGPRDGRRLPRGGPGRGGHGQRRARRPRDLPPQLLRRVRARSRREQRRGRLSHARLTAAVPWLRHARAVHRADHGRRQGDAHAFLAAQGPAPRLRPPDGRVGDRRRARGRRHRGRLHHPPRRRRGRGAAGRRDRGRADRGRGHRRGDPRRARGGARRARSWSSRATTR